MSAEPARSLSDRRRDFTRDQVARVAIGLFDTHGYDGVTVDDIAAAAGISVRTFFRYFPTKEDVVLHEHDIAELRLVRALAGRPSEEGAVTALRHAFIESSTIRPADRALVLQYGRVQAQSPTLTARSQGARVVANHDVVALVARRMGVAVHDARAETVVAAMTAVASAAFRRWVDGGGRGNPSAQIASSLDLVECGLASLDHVPPQPRALRKELR